MDDIGRLPYPVVCYCATCDRVWDWGKNEFLGYEFTCPEEKHGKHKHLARLILDERPAYRWLRIEWFLYLWQKCGSPVALLNCLLKKYTFGKTGLEAGGHMILWFII